MGSVRAATALLIAAVAVACGGGEAGAAKAAITSNWETFFDASLPVEPKVELLEHGELLRDILVASADNPAVAGLRATVKSIELAEDQRTATVTFELRNGETVLLPAARGTAELIDGTWKLDATLFCHLQALAGTFCPELPEE